MRRPVVQLVLDIWQFAACLGALLFFLTEHYHGVVLIAYFTLPVILTRKDIIEEFCRQDDARDDDKNQ